MWDKIETNNFVKDKNKLPEEQILSVDDLIGKIVNTGDNLLANPKITEEGNSLAGRRFFSSVVAANKEIITIRYILTGDVLIFDVLTHS